MLRMSEQCGRWKDMTRDTLLSRTPTSLTISLVKLLHVPGEASHFTSTPVTGSQWEQEFTDYTSGLPKKISPECWNLGETLNPYTTWRRIISREVVFSMREGDQNHLPNLTSVHGNLFLSALHRFWPTSQDKLFCTTMKEGSTLKMMVRNLSSLVADRTPNCSRRNVICFVRNEEVEAVWQGEKGVQLFITFTIPPF